MRKTLNFYLVLVNTEPFVSHMAKVCVTSREGQKKGISCFRKWNSLEERKLCRFPAVQEMKQINKPGHKFLRDERFNR